MHQRGYLTLQAPYKLKPTPLGFTKLVLYPLGFNTSHIRYFYTLTGIITLLGIISPYMALFSFALLLVG